MSRKPAKPAPIQTPGSPYAVLHGCTCSPLTNNYGHGANLHSTQSVRFVIATGCPMHDFDDDEYCWFHDADMEAQG